MSVRLPKTGSVQNACRLVPLRNEESRILWDSDRISDGFINDLNELENAIKESSAEHSRTDNLMGSNFGAVSFSLFSLPNDVCDLNQEPSDMENCEMILDF